MKKRAFSKRVIPMLLVLTLLFSTLLSACSGSGKATTGNNGTTAGKNTETTGKNTETTGNNTATSGTTAPDDDKSENGQKHYTFIVKGQGGLPLSNVAFTVTDAQGAVVFGAVTDENGSYSAWLDAAQYTVTVDGLKAGYTAESIQTTAEGGAFEIVAKTAVITSAYPQQPNSYAVGDVMYDFAFLKDGEEVRLSELLQTKKLVIINFWATWCSPCKSEFPAMQAAYEQYGDEVEIVAFSTYDDAAACAEFKENNGYTFNMIPDIGLYSRFTTGTSIPLTVFVDRYGVVNNRIVGANASSDEWLAEMYFYTSDEYVQGVEVNTDTGDDQTPEQEKPDVEMPASADIEAAVGGKNFSGSFTASEDEYVWPWVLGQDKQGNPCIEPSNYEKPSTNAIINTKVELKAGEMFAFDYEYSIEYDIYGYVYYDLFAVYVDGHIVQSLFHKQDGKVTCYAYAPLETGTYEISLAYVKDSGADTWGFMEPGEEYIHVNNLRVISVDDVAAEKGSTDVWRPAAQGERDADTKMYQGYVDVVLNETDGYYHVGTADGPLLLAKLTGATKWSDSSLEVLGYNGYLIVDGVDLYADFFSATTYFSYVWKEVEADIHYCPVDETLADLLQLVAANVSDGTNHDKEWLEFCSYFDHYGIGEGIRSAKDLRNATDFESAHDAVLGKNHFFVNHAYVPRGTYYKFVAPETGVYHIYPLADTAVTSDGYFSTILWLYDENGNLLKESSEEDGDGNNFDMYKTLEAGKTYYFAPAMDPVDTLGSFDFMIEFTDLESWDVMQPCAQQYTTTEDGSRIIVDKFVDAVLCEDGYYRRLFADGSVDMSEHGYIYVDFLHSSDFMSLVPYKDDFCTLYNYIIKGYAYLNDDREIVFGENAFDFANRIDLQGTDYVNMGNYQEQMEAFLEMALALDPSDFEYGYVKATPELIEILECLIRLYGMTNSDDTLVEDQWLQFCYYADHA